MSKLVIEDGETDGKEVCTSYLSLALSLLEDSGPSVEIGLDMERHAFHLYLHILGYRLGTCKVSSCYTNLTLIAYCTGRILRGHVATIIKSSPPFPVRNVV